MISTSNNTAMKIIEDATAYKSTRLQQINVSKWMFHLADGLMVIDL